MEAVLEASLSLHLSKCHVVGNHMSRLILFRGIILNMVIPIRSSSDKVYIFPS